MLLNPYIAGNPLKDRSAFFGRDDIVREVTQMLNHPDEKAIVLYGQRRIGKTTILLQIDQKLTTEGNFTPVYFDLQDRASSTLSDVLYKLAQTISHRLKQPLPVLENFDADGSYFMKMFLPEIIKFSAPSGLVLLFDEFDVMDSPEHNHAGQEFFPYLRSIIADIENVKFIFVIGRRPEELSTETLSTFKGIRATRVSLLGKDAIESVIRQSEKAESLFWSDDAVAQIWTWTQGHTYFTQLLCSVIWERLQEKATNKETPMVTPEDVEVAIQQALKQGANAFHWIWGGLPPAERVVMAAMAEAKGDVISQDEIEETLNQSGVRLIVRELKIAPMTLIDWELLRPVDNNYRFAVPLLRRWVKNNRPLIRVKEELDRLDPLAENLFQSGQSFYGLGKADEAVLQLRQALNANPNHLKSRLLLGRLLFERGTPENLGEAVQVLDEGYKYDKIAVEADYIKTLLAYSDTKDTEEQKMEIYERILEMRPNQTIARGRRSIVLIAKGDHALAKGDYSTALKAFTDAGDIKKIASVREIEQEKWRDMAESALKEKKLDKAIELFQLVGDESRIQYVTELIEKKWMDEQLNLALQAEKREHWASAIEIYSSINERFPNRDNILELIGKAQDQSRLAQLYKEAIGNLKTGQLEKARRLFVQILQKQPDYKDVARRLYQIVEGIKPSPPRGLIIGLSTSVGKILLIVGIWLSVAIAITVIAIIVGFVIDLGYSSGSGTITMVFFTVGGTLSLIISSIVALIVAISLFSKNRNE